MSTATTSLQRWLVDYCSQSNTLTGCVVLTATLRGEFTRIVAEWPERNTINQPLIDAAISALKRNLEGIVVPPVIQTALGPQRIIHVLLENLNERCVVALGINNPNDSVAQGYLSDLRSQKTHIEKLLQATENFGVELAGTLLTLQTALLGHEHLEAAATAFVNELAATFGFDRCSFGLLEEGRIRILALSHNAGVEQKQALLRTLAAAMEEAADQGATLVQPPRQDDPPRILLAHKEFAERAGGSLTSIPLAREGKPVGVVSIERRGSPSLSRDEVAQCEHLAGLIAPLVALRWQAEQPLPQRLGEQFRQFRRQFASERNRNLRIALAVVAFVLLAVLAIPAPYRLTADARLEGAEQRLLVAPTDGFIKQVHVRPGDVVQAGQLLAEMADQDLRLEESKWQAEFTQHENAYIAAMARADRAGFSISRAKANEAMAQLDLVRSQLDRMRIVAPADGIVVQGDLTQSLGAPVRRGDTLLTLAPRGQHRLIVDIDERDIGDVRVGRSGSLVLSALPDTPIAFTADRIVPVAVSRDGRNLFEVEAHIDNDMVSLRPGMEGIAKLDADKRPLIWQFSHRIVTWLRLQLFSWGL